MARNFIKMSREEREAKILADGIADGSIIPVGSGPLPEDRNIDLPEQLRAARLDALARAFAVAAIDGERDALLSSRRFSDLRFHPRYKREWLAANRPRD